MAGSGREAQRALLQLENYLKSVKLILFIRMMILIRYLSVLNNYYGVITSLDSIEMGELSLNLCNLFYIITSELLQQVSLLQLSIAQVAGG